MIQPNYQYREVHVDFAPSELRDARAHLADSLEELPITQENYRDPQHSTLNPGVMPLADFENLKNLEASAIVLVGTSSVVRHLDTPYTEEQFRTSFRYSPFVGISLDQAWRKCNRGPCHCNIK
ncbi:hypothetical protein N431DRAFT_526340 [Stipitochalara longipes BDJ]|nr:hypothetical protein N431DRAFT_526340 [Stipitochalara longipes BDJ]